MIPDDAIRTFGAITSSGTSASQQVVVPQDLVTFKTTGVIDPNPGAGLRTNSTMPGPFRKALREIAIVKRSVVPPALTDTLETVIPPWRMDTAGTAPCAKCAPVSVTTY